MMKGRPKMGLSGWMAGHIIYIKTRQKKIEVNFSILLIVALLSAKSCVWVISFAEKSILNETLIKLNL